MKKTLLFLLLLPLLSGFACARVKVAKPEGFAIVKGNRDFKAVSPEGVIYKVRYVKNYPVMSLDFWARALKKQLESGGYRFIKEEAFTAGPTPGMLFEWGAPYGNENYVYLTSILVVGKRIAIAEAAAEFKLYNRYRDALVKSLASIKLL